MTDKSRFTWINQKNSRMVVGGGGGGGGDFYKHDELEKSHAANFHAEVNISCDTHSSHFVCFISIPLALLGPIFVHGRFIRNASHQTKDIQYIGLREHIQ